MLCDVISQQKAGWAGWAWALCGLQVWEAEPCGLPQWLTHMALHSLGRVPAQVPMSVAGSRSWGHVLGGGLFPAAPTVSLLLLSWWHMRHYT